MAPSEDWRLCETEWEGDDLQLIVVKLLLTETGLVPGHWQGVARPGDAEEGAGHWRESNLMLLYCYHGEECLQHSHLREDWPPQGLRTWLSPLQRPLTGSLSEKREIFRAVTKIQQERSLLRASLAEERWLLKPTCWAGWSVSGAELMKLWPGGAQESGRRPRSHWRCIKSSLL